MPPIEEVHVPLKDERPQSYSLKSMLGWKHNASGNLINTMKQRQEEVEHLGWKNFIDVSDDTQRLLEAVKHNDMVVSERLLKTVPGIANKTDQRLNTSLHWAVRRGSLPMVWLLVKFGANCDLKNYFGMSSYDIALNIVNDYNMKVNLVGHKAVKYETWKVMHHI